MITEIELFLVHWIPVLHNVNFYKFDKMTPPPKKKKKSTVETYNFLSFRALLLIWMSCMKKVGWLFCCMEVRTWFKLFYWPIIHLAVRVGSFNSKTITERLNSCTTKIVQYATRLMPVRLPRQLECLSIKKGGQTVPTSQQMTRQCRCQDTQHIRL